MTDWYKIKRILTWVNWEEKQIYPVKSKERIEYKMNADSSWNLYVPTSWYATSWIKNCPYDWKVSVDWWAETTYTWTSSSWGYITLSWYTAWSNHTITIKPTTEWYQWARAYSWQGTSWATYITDILYDSSYMWYAVSATDTWDYFRAYQYYECTALTTPTEEYLPDTVTTIWAVFRRYQYYGCSWLTTPATEVLPNSVTTIWNYFRWHQYYWCSWLTYATEEALSSSITSIWTYYRTSQYQACSSLVEIKWLNDSFSTSSNYYRRYQFSSIANWYTIKTLSDVWPWYKDSAWISNTYVTAVYVPSAYLTNFKNTTNQPWYSITDSKFIWY